MSDGNEDRPVPEDTPTVTFDPDTSEITFDIETQLAEFDLNTLRDMGVLTADVEEREGEKVVTHATLNLEYLGLMATEFNTTERSLGKRFSRSRYRPDIRLRF